MNLRECLKMRVIKSGCFDGMNERWDNYADYDIVLFNVMLSA